MKKNTTIIYIILIAFFTSFFTSFGSKVSAADDLKIISDTSITVETAKEWAKSKGATDTFVNLADLYYKYFKDHGNVNPALAYAQSAKETGYGKFTGVIDESFNNPCGLKTAKGGADSDPNCHKRFESWDQGVQAHLDHLAIYAGAEGYPRKETYDSRHFESIFNTAATICSLGGKWAPSSTYGNEIMKLYNEMLDIQGDCEENSSDSSKNINFCIDELRYYSNERLKISGWILGGQDSESNVDIYINNSLKASFTPNINREDVYDVFPSFNNHISGFDILLDISDIQNGNNKFKFVITNKDGSKVEKESDIDIQRPGSGNQFLVALDPGHCNGTDEGAVKVVNGVTYKETQLNLEIGLKTAEVLRKNGFRVILTRENNNAIGSSLSDSLSYRVNVANNANADLFLSIHQNASNGNINGTEGFYYPGNEKAKKLVAQITHNISQVLENNDRGAKPDTATYVGSLFVIRNTNMTSALVECGFMDNASEVLKLSNSDCQYQIANAITDAIITIYGKQSSYEENEPNPITFNKLNNDKQPEIDKPSGSDTPNNDDKPSSNQGSDTPNNDDKPSSSQGSDTPNNDDKPSSSEGNDKPGSVIKPEDPPTDVNSGSSTFDSNSIVIILMIMMSSIVVCKKMRKAN